MQRVRTEVRADGARASMSFDCSRFNRGSSHPPAPFRVFKAEQRFARAAGRDVWRGLRPRAPTQTEVAAYLGHRRRRPRPCGHVARAQSSFVPQGATPANLADVDERHGANSEPSLVRWERAGVRTSARDPRCEAPSVPGEGEGEALALHSPSRGGKGAGGWAVPLKHLERPEEGRDPGCAPLRLPLEHPLAVRSHVPL